MAVEKRGESFPCAKVSPRFRGNLRPASIPREHWGNYGKFP